MNPLSYGGASHRTAGKQATQQTTMAENPAFAKGAELQASLLTPEGQAFQRYTEEQFAVRFKDLMLKDLPKVPAEEIKGLVCEMKGLLQCRMRQNQDMAFAIALSRKFIQNQGFGE